MIVNDLGFESHVFSVTTTQLSYCSVKLAMDNKDTNESIKKVIYRNKK